MIGAGHRVSPDCQQPVIRGLPIVPIGGFAKVARGDPVDLAKGAGKGFRPLVPGIKGDLQNRDILAKGQHMGGTAHPDQADILPDIHPVKCRKLPMEMKDRKGSNASQGFKRQGLVIPNFGTGVKAGTKTGIKTCINMGNDPVETAGDV
eukprot:NODE_6584_length_631_cov_0.835317_g6561_i0.p2 GENE.NODE_6584_length_631_cov_0.835317_g6561_i0~~NODE_6584_length_631_cov_0.835317_g6561_i0.p2  ORF type:complete len:149 (-),score=6.89 NODE_6584_length_631_cov_0.835317_g6561_i0:172-618(-)